MKILIFIFITLLLPLLLMGTTGCDTQTASDKQPQDYNLTNKDTSMGGDTGLSSDSSPSKSTAKSTSDTDTNTDSNDQNDETTDSLTDNEQTDDDETNSESSPESNDDDDESDLDSEDIDTESSGDTTEETSADPTTTQDSSGNDNNNTNDAGVVDGGDDTGFDEDVCDEANFAIERKKVDVLIALDRSLSMEESGLWAPMGQALTEVTALTEEHVNYGLETFPFTDEDCSTGNILIDIGENNAQAIADVVGGGPNDIGTILGTPTAESMRVARQYLDIIDNDLEKFVILANDGAPNCNDSLDATTCRCSIDVGGGCIPEWCLDDQATVDAVTELREAGYPTYVLGIGDSMQWEDVMNNIAVAGGTNQYIPADSTEFVDTLMGIIRKLVSCEYEMDWDSLDESADPDPTKVNFYCKQSLDEPNNDDPVNGNIIPQDEGCAAKTGWSWVKAGSSVLMCEDTCEKLRADECRYITATFGCDTVIIVV